MSYETKPYHLLGTPAQDTAQSLRAAFNAARYGHYFRTLTMLNTNTANREWLYAVQDPLLQRCTLMRVQDSAQDDMEHRSIVREGMNFIDALEHMARFDSTILNPGMAPAIEGEIESLSLSHYRLFANREGLALNHDTHRFHPSVKGHVVTSGLYDRSELNRVQEFSSQKHKSTDPFPVPQPHVLRANIQNITDKMMALFQDEEQLGAVLSLHKALHKIEQFWMDKERDSLDVRTLGIFLPNEDFTAETSKAFENQGLKSKLRQQWTGGDPYEGRQSAFFHARIMSRLREIKIAHPDLHAPHQSALQDHAFCAEFALARRNAIELMGSSKTRTTKEQHGQYLKNHLATLDKMAAKRGISPEGISFLHAAIYGTAQPAIFADTTAFTTLLQTSKYALDDHIQAEKIRLQKLLPSDAVPSYGPGIRRPPAKP